MKRLLLMVCLLGLVASCVSIPPESITAQEKIGSGIETARRNQLLLIDKFAEKAKDEIRLAYRIAVPSVLNKKYPGKASYSSAEVESLLAEYGKDIESDLRKIDNKRASLVQDTNRFFDDLGSINILNLEMLKSAVELNRAYKASFDQIKDRANSKIDEILSK
jgi:hypothetical protein